MWYQACLQPSRTERGQSGMAACWMQVTDVGLHRWRRSVVGPLGNSEGVQSSGQWTEVRLHPLGVVSPLGRWISLGNVTVLATGTFPQTKYYSTCTLTLPADHPPKATHPNPPVKNAHRPPLQFRIPIRHSYYVAMLHVNPEAPGHSEPSR